MGTTPEHTGPSRRRVYTDLFDELAFHRHAEYAGHMARALLRMERDGKDLVGLTDDHERAVYYSSAGRTLRGYAFDKHGVREAEFDTVWRLLSDAASWVDAHQDQLDWIHPHYRWVLDLEDDRDVWGFQP
ncbi:MAG: hypothetical protein V5A38_01930 [Halolamina sp.]|uniref:hypothetical protein n=1 Tax=Halolamina sp. TaxID=1940283 RepID=UPI002FC3A4C9